MTEREKLKSCGVAVAAAVILLVMSFPCFGGPVVLAASGSDLRGGIAVSIDGMPAFVRYEGDMKPGDSFSLRPAGANQDISVAVLPEKEERESVVILPILIEDKSLAKGVTLELITPAGNHATINIPPKRVFLSIPFTIPVTGATHEDFDRDPRHLILQIVPKITKKAQVNIDNTATDGLVADLRYEGIAYMKFKDVLNRTNRRDMDGTFFIGKEKEYQWALLTENLFEKFDDRTIGVMKNHKMSDTVSTQWRLDNIHDAHSSRFGLNTIYKNGKTYVKLGNIDRVVKGKIHNELGYGTDRFNLVTRFEGMEIVNPSTRSAVAMKVDRFGYQFRFAGGNERNYYEGRAGNLKVQDFNDEGEVDDYFNFDIKLTTRIGGMQKSRRGWTASKFTYSGEVATNLWGRGSASWMEGSMDMNVGYREEYLAFIRYNNDFARITGKVNSPLWESLFVSFMRNRNYFNPNDPLRKYGLDSIFMDFEYSREMKTHPYARKIRFGVARFTRIWKYDLPIEVFIERGQETKFRPGISLSIRRYL